MGFFDRLANVGKGWVATRRNQSGDVDLVAAAEERIAEAREALGRIGQQDPELDAEETRLKEATGPARPVTSDPVPASPPDPAPEDDRPLAPERDEEGNIIKRL